VCLLLLFVLSPVSAALAAPPEPGEPGTAEQIIVGDDVATALEYWTPQRMAEEVSDASLQR
jgi:hypothetical protein